MSHVLPVLTDLLAAVPDPGAGSEPPGFESVTTIMSWVKYLSLGVLVVALMIGGARLAFDRMGGGHEQGAAIGKTLVGVIVVSAAFSLVTALAS